MTYPYDAVPPDGRDEWWHDLNATAWHAGWFAFDKVHPCKICGLTWEEFSK